MLTALPMTRLDIDYPSQDQTITSATFTIRVGAPQVRFDFVGNKFPRDRRKMFYLGGIPSLNIYSN